MPAGSAPAGCGFESAKGSKALGVGAPAGNCFGLAKGSKKVGGGWLLAAGRVPAGAEERSPNAGAPAGTPGTIRTKAPKTGGLWRRERGHCAVNRVEAETITSPTTSE